MTELIDRLRHKVIPAVPVPFDSDGRIAATAMRQYAHWMASQQVGAVAVWAHTGRGLMLSESQRAEVLESWSGILAGVPIICGVGAPESEALPVGPAAKTDRVIDLTVSLAKAARDGGAAGLLVYPPTSLRGLPDLDERVIELHRAVAEVGLSTITFYLYHDAGGIPYSFDTVNLLLELDGVIGIKIATLDSVMTFQDVTGEVLHHPEALIISGEDRFLGYSLTLGAHCALVGMAAACTEASVALLNSWFARHLDSFTAQSADLDEFARATFRAPMDGYVQRMLWALEADGVIPTDSRDPFGPELTDEDQAIVQSAVAKLRKR